MSKTLPTRCYMTRIEAFGVSVSGDPFADVQLIHPQGPTLYARAFESSFGDLNQLHDFEGREVNLQVTPTGLELLPLSDQVIPEPGDSIDSGDGQDQLEDQMTLNLDSIFFPPEEEPVEMPYPSETATMPIVQEVAAMVEQVSPAEQIRRDACWPPLRTSETQRAPQRSQLESGSCRRAESIQQVAGTVARLAKEHSLATCMWIHLP